MLTATLPTAPPLLPPGFAPAPPVSGVLTTVVTELGAAVRLHRAEYTTVSRRGEFTSHGYAWRCTRCRHVTTGYPATGFGRAHRDAGGHVCGAHDG